MMSEWPMVAMARRSIGSDIGSASAKLKPPPPFVSPWLVRVSE